MDKKATSLMLGIIIVAIIVIAVFIAFYMGYIPLSFADNDEDMSQPVGSDYCDFTTGQIIGMFENLASKDLNNDIGYTVINGLNMRACGSNSKLPSEIVSKYMSDYTNWYVLVDDTTMSSGFYYRTVIWGNAPLLSNSTLIRGCMSGNGVTIKEWYNYETLTITAYGTKSGYLSFALWLTS